MKFLCACSALGGPSFRNEGEALKSRWKQFLRLSTRLDAAQSHS